MAMIQGGLAVSNLLSRAPEMLLEYPQYAELSPGWIDYIALFCDKSIWWFIMAFLAIVVGWIVDAYMDESDALYRYMSTPFFLLAAGLLIWGSSEYIINMSDTLRAFQVLGIAIVLAVIVSYVGVQFANQVRQIMQYRTIETLIFKSMLWMFGSLEPE